MGELYVQLATDVDQSAYPFLARNMSNGKDFYQELRKQLSTERAGG